MEVNEVKRGGRVVRAGTPAVKQSKGALTSKAPAKADRLALSRQVLEVLEERNRQLMAESRKQEGSSANKLLEKGLKTLNKCQKIYARIANGDKVPPEDMLYLERNDPEGFKMALAMRKPKKNPKEWESVLDKEDRAELATESEGSAPAGET